LTNVKAFNFPSSVFSTVDATVNATAANSITVDASVTAPYSTRFLINLSRLYDSSTLNMLPHAIAEGLAPNITVTIHSVQTPMMLNSRAQISVLPSDIAADFNPPISLPSVTREVRTCGNHRVTLRGPISLEHQLCGFCIRHPFYFIDASTPVIDGYDVMRAARLTIDVENGLVWSRRPESATKGPIGPNPEFPVHNNSVHSSVAMTEPQHAHRVVVTSSLAALDTEAAGTSIPQKCRRTISRNSLAPLLESSEPITAADVTQQDVKRVHVTEMKDEEDIAASVMEINSVIKTTLMLFGRVLLVACCLMQNTQILTSLREKRNGKDTSRTTKSTIDR